MKAFCKKYKVQVIAIIASIIITPVLIIVAGNQRGYVFGGEYWFAPLVGIVSFTCKGMKTMIKELNFDDR